MRTWWPVKESWLEESGGMGAGRQTVPDTSTKWSRTQALQYFPTSGNNIFISSFHRIRIRQTIWVPKVLITKVLSGFQRCFNKNAKRIRWLRAVAWEKFLIKVFEKAIVSNKRLNHFHISFYIQNMFIAMQLRVANWNFNYYELHKNQWKLDGENTRSRFYLMVNWTAVEIILSCWKWLCKQQKR